MSKEDKTTAVDDARKEHSPLPWRSVYPLGSKQRCAAVQAGDHYVYLNVFKPDDMLETIRMHQANRKLKPNEEATPKTVDILAATRYQMRL